MKKEAKNVLIWTFLFATSVVLLALEDSTEWQIVWSIFGLYEFIRILVALDKYGDS